METVKANAMLAGIGRTRRVLMGDTLLDKFSPDEIEVIFAHEIGHHVYRHIWKLVIGGVVFRVLGFFLIDRVVMAWAHRHGCRRSTITACRFIRCRCSCFA